MSFDNLDLPSVDTIKTWILNVSAFFAASINFFLIILIVKKSPKSIGSYKYLMNYIALVELTYAILSVAEKPDIFTKGSAFLIITNTKESLFPRFISICVDVTFVGFYGLTISLLTIHFIYRYLAISKSKILETFQNWKIIFWFLYPIINFVFWLIATVVIFAATDDSNRFLRNTYLPTKSNGTKFEDLYSGGPFFYLTNSNGNRYTNWRAFAGSTMILSFIGFSFVTIVYFGLKCYKTMNKMMKLTSVSDKYQKIQSQLFSALVFQTIIPFFLMHIPATIVYITIFFDCSMEIYGEILNMTIAIYPALNPLPTIFIVKSYRTAVIDVLLCRKPGYPSNVTNSNRSIQTTTRVSTA